MTTVHVLVVKATWGPAPETKLAAIEQQATTFFRNASFGTVQLQFDETPWLQAFDSPDVCARYDTLSADAANAAAQWTPSSYDRVVDLTPCFGDSVGNPHTRTAIVSLGILDAKVLEHELGHTFGMSHAGGLTCDRTCRLDQYANPIDVMGTGSGDFGALQKVQAGWPVNVVDAVVPGTYTLAAIERSSTLPQALVLHRGPYDLWIEHRAAIGNDATITRTVWAAATAGVLVHEAPAGSPTIPFDERRPDFLLGTPRGNDPFIATGKRFVIPHVVEIDVVKRTSTTVTVRLKPLG
ncbi:MAG: hypothetical protein ABUS54_12550 [Actinomycetota bacterium]